MSTIQSAPLNGENRFAHIDAMRAFAVLLVVVAHAGLGHIVPGGSGVTIFFSISGFIITYLLLRERDKSGGFSARDFYMRRIIKIGPPLLAIVVLPGLGLVSLGLVDFSTLLSQVLFVFNWAYLNGATGFMDGSDVVWSLAIEEQFYIIFAVIWLLVVRLSQWRVILFSIALFAVVYSTIARIVMSVDPTLNDRIYYGSDTRMDGIAWGVLAAIAFHWMQRNQQMNSRIARWLANDLALFGAIALYFISLLYRDEDFRDTFRYTLQSLAACVVILYGLLPGSGRARSAFYRLAQLRFITLIGLASYSIYLVHLVLMNSLRGAMIFSQPINTCILIVIGLSAGVLVYKSVEVPIHKWSVDRRQKRKASAVT